MKSVITNNTVADQRSPESKRILLLYKKISIINSQIPKIQMKNLALFDIGSQLLFISTNLINRFQETKNEKLNVASFDNKTPKNYY